MTALDIRRLAPEFVIDLVDGFALLRKLSGEAPRPFGWLRVLLSAFTPTGGLIQNLATPPELVLTPNSSGFLLFFGRVVDPGRSPRRLPLPAGSYDLIVESQYYQTANISASLPRQPHSPNVPQVKLAPNYDYPFPVGTSLLRGSVLQADGTGIAAATVSIDVPNSLTYRTDQSGQWALEVPITVPDPPPQDPPTADVTVTYHTSGAPDQVARRVRAVFGISNSLGATALQGMVTSGGIGIAAAAVAISSFATTVQTRVDGSWSYFFEIDQPAGVVDVTVTLSDGRSQTITGVSIVPRTTTLLPPVSFPKP
jgi:hypothetical protein